VALADRNRALGRSQAAAGREGPSIGGGLEVS
jgi:hypothetical protein